MVSLTLPKDAVLHLDPNIAVHVTPFSDGSALHVHLRTVRTERAKVIPIVVGLFAFAGGFLARDFVPPPPAQAEARQESVGAPPSELPTQTPVLREPGAMLPPRPPATVVRPEGRPAPPAADPFGLMR